MSPEMQHMLDCEMEDARKIADPARRLDAMLTVLVHQCRALVECQLKTAERVKALGADAEAKRNRIAPLSRIFLAVRHDDWL